MTWESTEPVKPPDVPLCEIIQSGTEQYEAHRQIRSTVLDARIALRSIKTPDADQAAAVLDAWLAKDATIK